MNRPTGSRGRVAASLTGLGAAALLAGLLAGVPFGLTRWVGWPLPHHWPGWTQIRDTLTGSFDDRLLVNTLACLCWLIWAVFVLDVLRAAPTAARHARTLSAGPPRGRHAGSPVARGQRVRPLQGLAAVLVAAIVAGVISLRPHPASAQAPARVDGHGTAPRTPTVSAPQHTAGGTATVAAESGRATAIVQPPHDGIHDSLWRVAARYLGNGERWPEIYRLNVGLPQPDGHTLQNPSLVQPGWVLRLPAGPGVARSAPGATPDPAPTPSTGPRTPDAPSPAPSPKDSPAPTTATPSDPTAPVPTTSSPHSLTPTPSATTQPSASEPEWPSARAVSRSTGGGLDVGDGVFVGLGLAGAVSGALLTVRRRRRRLYVPGSGRRDDLLPVAPVVRTLHLAHLRAIDTQPPPHDHLDTVEDDSPERDEPAEPERSGPDPHPAAERTEVRVAPTAATTPAPASERSRSVPAAALGSETLAIDIPAMRGLGLVGPGAPSAALALLLHLLTATDFTVVVAADTARCLRLPDAAHRPRRLWVVDGLPAGLDTAETLILRHARRLHTSDGNAEPAATRTAHTDIDNTADADGLVLFADIPGDTRRLQAVLETGSSAGIGAVLLGQWRAGASVYIDEAGLVSATSPGASEPLRGARLFGLPPAEAGKVLALLREAEPPERSERPLVAEPLRPATPPAAAPTIAPPANDANGQGARLASRAPAAAETAKSEDARHTEPATSTAAPRQRSTARLRLEILGPVRLCWAATRSSPVAVGDGTAVDVSMALTARLRELLVLMALHPDGISREVLAETLWPGRRLDRPFATLNTTLARLRRAVSTATDDDVPDVVALAGDRYRLDSDAVWVDYTVFSDALAAARAGRDDGERDAAYRRVVTAYGGELAEGLAAEWVETPREAARRDAVDAATGLARLLAGDDPRAALDQLEVARGFDPYNEALYRDIMTLQRRLGRADAIERTLGLLTTRLAELDETPDPQTLAHAQRLRQHNPSGHAESTPSAEGAPAAHPPSASRRVPR